MDSIFITIFLATTVLLSTISAQCTIAKATPSFRRATYEFTTEITKRIAEDTENHFVTSPLSVWSLVSAISEGAGDPTLGEIRKVLQHHGHKCFLYKYYQILKNVVTSDAETAIERSGLLVFDQSLRVKEDFQRDIEKIGIGEVLSISFANFYNAAEIVNDHVTSATHGAIDEVVTPEDMETKFLVLLDAIYFKGKWKTPFSPAETEVSAFYDEREEQIGDVNLMFRSGSFNLVSVPTLKAQAVELPYGNHSMVILLPFKGEPLSNVAQNLENISMKAIFNLFATTGPVEAHVNLPRFKITSSLDNLKELLSDMGLRTMFDDTQASFPFVSDYSIFVSDLVQKADIEVTEEGTEAGAVSVAGFESRMLPAQFNANRPFMFLIVEKSTEIVLFTGAYSKPAVF